MEECEGKTKGEANSTKGAVKALDAVEGKREKGKGVTAEFEAPVTDTRGRTADLPQLLSCFVPTAFRPTNAMLKTD